MPVIRGGKAILVGPGGDLVQVDPSEAAAKIATGVFTDASEKQVQAVDQQAVIEAAEAKHKAELETPGAIANTALQTASRAITAPIDWAANKLGISETGINNLGQTPEQAAWTNRRVREMQEANPIAAGVGEIGGQLTAAAATGLGAGAGALSARLATGALGRTAIRAGIEGAAFGAVGEMEDPNASAQHVLAAGGMGLLLGAGTGGALHGAGAGLRRVFGRSGNELVNAAVDATEQQTRAATTNQSRLQSIFGKIAHVGSEAPEDLLREVGPGGTRTHEAIEVAEHFDSYVNTTAKRLSTLADEATTAVDNATQRVRSVALKEEGLRKLITPEVDTAERRLTADNLLKSAYAKFDEATAGIADLEAEEGVGLPAKSRKQLALVRRQFEQSVGNLSEESDLASRFEIADDLKRKVDNLTKVFREDAQSPKLPYSRQEQQALLQTASEINRFNDELRSSLESSRIWGSKVASAQKEINAVWHHGGVDAMREWGKEFQVKTVREDFETGRQIFETDPNSIASLLRNPQGYENVRRLRSMENYLDRMEELTKKIGDKYELGTQMSQAQEKLGAMRAMFEEAKDKAELANKWKLLETYKPTGKTAMVTKALGHVPLVHHLSELAEPAEAAKFLDTISLHGHQNTQSSILEPIAKWIHRGGVAASGAVMRGQPALTSAAISLFRGNHKSDQEATDARLQALYKADPAALGHHLQGVSDDVMMHAGAVSSNAISYLRSVVPPYLTRPDFMQPSKKMQMSLPDQLAFGRAWGTVVDPSSAIKDLQAGRLMPSQVSALKAVYPTIYDDLRTQTLAAIGSADAKGVKLPIHVRSQLSLLLDLDGANEPALRDDFAAHVRTLIVQNSLAKPPAQQQSTASSKLAASRRSPFDQATQEA